MNLNIQSTRGIIVLASALLYWGGVMFHAYRIRARIGRIPNVKPHGLRERLLWLGWLSVITLWILQPLLLLHHSHTDLLHLLPSLISPWSLIVGALLIIAGQASTYWCYVVMGNSWRMGVDKKEHTALIMHGPYRRIRHPIYLFQFIILLGGAFLLPTLLSLLVLLLHLVCILAKALDEERFLLNRHGAIYEDYCVRTGRFLPKW
jgi:protein-S-isoprenylcysteine O-methyltransferase Ste14